MFSRTPSNILSALMLLLLALVPLRAAWQQPVAESIAFVSGEHRLTGTIVDSNLGETTVGLTLVNLEVDGAVVTDRALVRVPRYPTSGLGDRVTVTCEIERPEPIEGFAYDTYLAARDVYAVCSSHDQPLLVASKVDQSLRVNLAQLRQRLTDRLNRSLPEPQSTLLSGLLFGVADFSDDWRDRFIATGTSHVVAASGFNVSIVMLVLFHVLTTLGVRRQRAFPLLLLGIAFYVVLAGLSPAILRAGVMGTLVLTARQLGRQTTMRNVVLLTIAVMLTANPLMLWDAGFQLSLASTVALIWFAPLLAKRLTWVPEIFGVREAFVGSLAATLFTLPIIIMSFGQVSIISPLVNMLVLPLVPLAMGFGAFGLLACFTYWPIGHYLMTPAWAVLTIMLDIVSAMASLPFGAVAIPDVARYLLAALTLFIVLALWRLASRSRSSS